MLQVYHLRNSPTRRGGRRRRTGWVYLEGRTEWASLKRWTPQADKVGLPLTIVDESGRQSSFTSDNSGRIRQTN